MIYWWVVVHKHDNSLGVQDGRGMIFEKREDARAAARSRIWLKVVKVELRMKSAEVVKPAPCSQCAWWPR